MYVCILQCSAFWTAEQRTLYCSALYSVLLSALLCFFSVHFACTALNFAGSTTDCTSACLTSTAKFFNRNNLVIASSNFILISVAGLITSTRKSRHHRPIWSYKKSIWIFYIVHYATVKNYNLSSPLFIFRFVQFGMPHVVLKCFGFEIWIVFTKIFLWLKK